MAEGILESAHNLRDRVDDLVFTRKTGIHLRPQGFQAVLEILVSLVVELLVELSLRTELCICALLQLSDLEVAVVALFLQVLLEQEQRLVDLPHVLLLVLYSGFFLLLQGLIKFYIDSVTYYRRATYSLSSHLRAAECVPSSPRLDSCSGLPPTAFWWRTVQLWIWRDCRYWY